MKNILLGIILILISLNTLTQESKLLSYFSIVKNDSIINTRYIKYKGAYLCDRFYKNNVPDSITLKYFFDNDTANMYYEAEDYSPDFNIYTTEVIKKKVCPLFYKKNREYYLLCYKIVSIIYLSIYDAYCDTIISTYVVSDYTDEYGNQVTHSIIFPNNYIATVEIIGLSPDVIEVFYRLIKIEEKTFKILKEIEKKEKPMHYDKIYQKVYEILGITEKGELIK